MRIPFPERISYFYAAIFASVLVTVQFLEHTDILFSVMCFAFIMLSVGAFNVAGGAFRPAGAYIAFAALLDCIIGLVAKCFFGEAANSNLKVPLRTMEVYVGGMCAMLIAAMVEKAIRPARPLIVKLFPMASLRSVYLGAAALGVASNLMWTFDPRLLPPSIGHYLFHADSLGPFSIILGVIYTVQSSKGKNSVTPFLLGLIGLLTIQGISGFSKQGLFTPTFCWLLGAGISRYRLKPVTLLVLACWGSLILHYGVPIVQVGKGLGYGGDLAANSLRIKEMFLRFDDTKAQYKDAIGDDQSSASYFNHPEGFLDRLAFLSIDDLLIQATEQEGRFGYEPVKEGFENLIPHIFWADKPVPYFGNLYAHDLGLLSDDDYTTGISFSVMADIYREGGFQGVFLVLPLILAVVFCCMSWVAGDVRDHPASILIVLMVAHVAPEGMIPGTILLILYLVIVVAFGLMSRYIFPLVTAAVLPPPPMRSPSHLTPAID